MQFHWANPGYRDFDDFLAAFNHDKRKKIKPGAAQARRGRRDVRAQDAAREITAADWAFFYRCYERTYRAHHSTPYLTLEFFERIARDDARQPAAGASATATARRSARRSTSSTPTTLWGRYWGALEYVPGLHFEACYYQAIEFCIERGIARFEGGAQGVHKLARGLMPVTTHSAHAIADPAISPTRSPSSARASASTSRMRSTSSNRGSPFRSDAAIDATGRESA